MLHPSQEHVCSLEELQEAVGRLESVDVDELSILVTMDSARLIVDFPSVESLESASQLLRQYVGKRVAILRVAGLAEPLRIRLVTPQRRDASGDQK